MLIQTGLLDSVWILHNISGMLDSTALRLMRTNRHFFSPFRCFFLLHCVKTRALLHMHTHFLSPFTCVFHLHRVETALIRTRRHFFSPLLAFFSYTTWASANLASLCIHWHFAVHHKSFLRHQLAQWFLQLLNRLHAFVSRRVHCFLHVLKSVVAVLLTCQLEKCVERRKVRMSSCFCLHKWLEKMFV